MHAPTYVSVSDPATEEQVAQITAAAGDVYAVSHLCHSMAGRRKIQIALRSAGLSPELARCLGWATGFPPGFEPPAPTRDVAESPAPAFDPNASTSVLEQEPWMTEPTAESSTSSEPSPAADPPAISSAKPSRQR